MFFLIGYRVDPLKSDTSREDPGTALLLMSLLTCTYHMTYIQLFAILDQQNKAKSHHFYADKTLFDFISPILDSALLSIHKTVFQYFKYEAYMQYVLPSCLRTCLSMK